MVWNSHLRRELKRFRSLTLMDGQTSLPNRRGFNLLMHKSIKEARRANQPLSLVLMNIDSFSSINLQYGFDIGDALLERIAARLKELQPKTNVPCRWSGDEFIILLRDMSQVAARWSAETLRNHIEQETFLIDGQSIQVTASLGTATLTADDDHTSLLQRAHLALKNAKQAGGNTCYDVDDAHITP